jgi:hypothetical protein
MPSVTLHASLLHPAGLVAALISCGIPALLRGLPAPYAQQALQVLTSGTGRLLGLDSKSSGFGSVSGAQICETPEFRAAVQNSRSVVRKGLLSVDLEDLLHERTLLRPCMSTF